MILQMYSEGSPAVKQNNQTAMFYFKKAADKAIIFHMRQS